MTAEELATIRRQAEHTIAENANFQEQCGDVTDPHTIDLLNDSAAMARDAQTILELADEVKRLHDALRHCRDTLEAVLCNEATIEAGLWRGDMIPRRLQAIEELLGDKAGIISIGRPR